MFAPGHAAPIKAMLRSCRSQLVDPVDDELLVARTQQALFGEASSPTKIGRYVLVFRVGRGGGGAVYRGYDPRLRRSVAVKVVSRPGASAASIHRLAGEAEALARLQHPNVVEVYDVLHQPAQDRVVIILEWVEGGTLEEWVAEQTRSVGDVIAVYRAAACGLRAAHAAGLVHRDFKPANTLVDSQGRVRVADFGLAQAPGLASPGEITGTPAYMAPEQWAGGEVTARSDQYSFCASIIETLVAVTGAKDRKAALHARGISPRVREALLRGVSADARLRFPDMEQLALALTPRSGRARWPLAALATVAAVGGIALLPDDAPARPSAEAPCAQDARTATDRWGATRESVVGRLAQNLPRSATGVASHVDDRLQAYTNRWAASFRTTCSADLEAKEATRRRQCLSAIRFDAESTLEAIAVQGITPAKASRAVASLPAPITCEAAAEAGLMGWMPDGEEARSEADRFRRRLSSITALGATGAYAEATVGAATLLEELDASSVAPIALLAKLAHGRYLALDGQTEAATQTLAGAYFDASASGHDREAAEAATALTFLVGYHLADPEEGLRWSRYATGALDRLGLDGEPRAALQSHLGTIAATRGDLEASTRHHKAALALREPFAEQRPVQLAHTLNNLGNAMFRAGDYDEAGDYHTRCLDLRRAALGDAHSLVGTSLNNLGSVQMQVGGPSAARPTFEAALANWEAAYGPEHPDLLQVLHNLAVVATNEDRYEDAAALVRRGLEIARSQLPSDHPMSVMLRTDRAVLLLAAGDAEAASAEFGALLLAVRERHGDDHPDVGVALNQLGRAELALGRTRVAAAHFHAATQAYDNSVGLKHPSRFVSVRNEGLARLELGQAARALVLLEAVRDAEGVEISDRDAAELEASIDKARQSLAQRRSR